MLITEESLKREFGTAIWNTGYKFYKNGRAKIINVEVGYINETEDPVYVVNANFNADRVQYEIHFTIINNSIYNSRCNCRKTSNYYSYWEPDSKCVHVVAACLALVDYERERHIEVFTTKTANDLISDYALKQVHNTITDKNADKVELEPNILTGDGRIRVSFRVGSRKKYVIKNLYDFYSHMVQGSVVAYGKELQLLHDMNSFTEESKSLVAFVISRIQEHKLMQLDEYNYYSSRSSDNKALLLTPRSLDDLYDILSDNEVSYSGKSLKGEVGAVNKVSFITENPMLKLWIRRMNTTARVRTKDFQGVTLELEDIEYFNGEKYIYVRKGKYLYRTDVNYKANMESLLNNLSKSHDLYVKIGKEALSNFNRYIIPRVKNYLEIIREDVSELEEYIPVEPVNTFYLDYSENNITCKTVINYGDYEVDPYVQKEFDSNIRDFAKEYATMLCVRTYFPYYDEKLRLHHCNKDEDCIYRILDEGLKELMTLGVVNVSDELKRLQIKHSPKVSIGVSITSGIVDMVIACEDLDFEELGKILECYRLRKKYHRLKNGDFLSMEDNSLEMLTELVDGLQVSVKELAKGKMHIPAYRALYLDKVLQESEGVAYDRDTQFKNLIRNFKAVEDSDFGIPPTLNNVLRNYQKHGYRWLRMIEEYGFGGILADDMGLGKTLQVIALILSSIIEKKRGRTLIISPASLVYNWESEFRRFAPEIEVLTITGSMEERKLHLQNLDSKISDNGVLLTSYDLLKRDIEHYENVNFLYEVIDEAQYIKNPESQNAKAVKLINTKVRYALTGTPIENRLSELWSIFDYLMPGLLYKYDRFKKDIELPITKEKDEIATVRLKKMVLPFILRRIKSDVLKDLPDKIEQVTYSRMEDEQKKLYDAYVSKVRQRLVNQTSEEFQASKLKILAELTRLRQICCDPALCYEDYRGDSTKLNTCMELINEAVEGGHKVLLFSQFTSMLAIIANKLVQEGIGYYEITGATPKEKRLQLVQSFNKDATPIFLISLKAGGTGLNLTGADIVIHYDPWWNIAAQNQATDRAHRIGQTNTVTVFKIIVKDTIEEKILALQEAKKELADQIIDGEVNQLSVMNKDDFLELLQ